jgi:hypothetical protein
MENNIFDGIPSLDDEAGFQNLVAEQTAQQAAGTPAQTPTALQQTPVQQQQADPNSQGAPVQYTQEDIQRIIAENAQYKANIQAAQAQAQAQAQARAQAQVQANVNAQRQQMNPQLQNAIARALAAGYTPEQVYAAMRGNTAQAKIENQINQIQNYLEQQQYQKEEQAFIEKMTTFGNKWGLSEADLVTFSNKALELGINVAQVSDVEAVFRAVYPEQYAFRLQRMSNQNNASTIYGGASIPEAPRATQAKAEDAYVENFLKSKMPNAYNNFNNFRK